MTEKDLEMIRTIFREELSHITHPSDKQDLWTEEGALKAFDQWKTGDKDAVAKYHRTHRKIQIRGDSNE